MELSIRDWMMVIGVLLLLAVVLDGLRRAQKERRNQVRLSRNAKRMQKKKHQEDEADEHSFAELPKGGARVIGSRDESVANQAAMEEFIPDVYEQSVVETKEATETIENSEATIIDDEAITKVDASDDVSADSSNVGAVEVVENEAIAEGESFSAIDDSESTITEESSDLLFDEPVFDYEAKAKKAKKQSNKKGKNSAKAMIKEALRSVNASDDVDEVEPEAEQLDIPLDDNETVEQEIDDIIVLHAMAAKDQPFKGRELQELLLACDCRFGKMDIFHRFENGDTGAEQFSIVNMVEPGTFDLDDIENFSTPGVSFFMRLPGPQEPHEALTCMVETARCLVKNLQGNLKDEQRSTLTDQTVEHYRDRINAHKKRQLMK